MKITIKTDCGTGFTVSNPEDVLLIRDHLLITEKGKYFAIPVSKISFFSEQEGMKQDLIGLIDFINRKQTEGTKNETTDGKNET